MPCSLQVSSITSPAVRPTWGSKTGKLQGLKVGLGMSRHEHHIGPKDGTGCAGSSHRGCRMFQEPAYRGHTFLLNKRNIYRRSEDRIEYGRKTGGGTDVGLHVCVCFFLFLFFPPASSWCFVHVVAGRDLGGRPTCRDPLRSGYNQTPKI